MIENQEKRNYLT